MRVARLSSKPKAPSFVIDLSLNKLWLSKSRYEDKALDFTPLRNPRVIPRGARQTVPRGMQASATLH